MSYGVVCSPRQLQVSSTSEDQFTYCDFVCLTLCGIHIERIEIELSYLSSVKPKLDAFFVKALLPLLLTGKNKLPNSSEPQPFQSQADPTPSQSQVDPSSSSSQTETFCWCGKEAYGRMVGCDNLNCKMAWNGFIMTVLG